VLGTQAAQIEAEFPAEVSVAEVDAKEGWIVELRRNAEGRIIGARNPMEGTTLVWKVIQVHADGARAEWIGERESRQPAPVTVIRSATAQ